LRNSVFDFGNESLVVDEGVIGERLRSADSESDEYQRDPLVESLNHAGLAENHFVQDDVVRVVVAVVQHGAPPGFLDQVLWIRFCGCSEARARKGACAFPLVHSVDGSDMDCSAQVEPRLQLL
jgi:hypothetical protein